MAEGHTPIYKMHKYFARRPQNVFNKLLQNYSKAGDIVLDPFCGGGVTLVEGTSLNRRVVTSDINPLATFVSVSEISLVDKDEYLREMTQIRNLVASFSKDLFTTRDRDTGDKRSVRWNEYSYIVTCPHCGQPTSLENENKLVVGGSAKNGRYVCEHCKKDFPAVSCKHTGIKHLSVTYKVTTRATQRTVVPDKSDAQASQLAEKLYTDKIVGEKWFVPDISIPTNWDRQQEDCLIRKGFTSFTDFFTHRSLVVMAYFLQEVKNRKKYVSPELYRLLLLTFSATLRYTNNMVISTGAWQDGRPVAWAKHAYWLSYQFVEVNPIEYIDKRTTAIASALEFQKKKNPGFSEASSFEDFLTSKTKFLVVNQDSSKLPLADESVDLVLTDPPYGGNVQYGELSAFWLSWIYKELGIPKRQVTELAGEILVHRKNKVQPKTHQTYYEGLNRVFSEAYRVLKNQCPLVFTFNSKDIKVWIAVMKAALDAGFILEPAGVHYQSPIENYKNTAHVKFAGTVQGDFIYTFLKDTAKADLVKKAQGISSPESIMDKIAVIVDQELSARRFSTTSQIYIQVLKQTIPMFASMILSTGTFSFAESIINGNVIENTIKSKAVWDKEKQQWRKAGL